MWLCHVHNQVNERLQKPEFDCAHLDATYDCGCGDEPIATSAAHDVSGTGAREADPMDLEVVGNRDDVTGVGLILGGK